MKKKTLQTGIFSVIGVAAVLLILVTINFIAGRVKQRVDLTADQNVSLYVRYNSPVYIADSGFPNADVIADSDSRSQHLRTSPM